MRNARQLSLLVPHRVRVGYIGWTGKGNLGDEAMYLVHKRLFPVARLQEVPFPREASRFATWAMRRGAFRVLMLGGGTLIGSPGIRRRLQLALSGSRPCPTIMLGTGVEDPRFSGEQHRGSEAELRSWRPPRAISQSSREGAPLPRDPRRDGSSN